MRTENLAQLASNPLGGPDCSLHRRVGLSCLLPSIFVDCLVWAKHTIGTVPINFLPLSAQELIDCNEPTFRPEEGLQGERV